MTPLRSHAARAWLPPSLRIALSLLLGLAAFASDVLPAPPTYRDRPEVRAFIQTLMAHDGFEEQALTPLLGAVHMNAEAAALVAPPKIPVRRNWRVYRSRFVEPQRIRSGVAFWHEHARTLARAEREYGVPAEILVGILGVETIYGLRMGRFPVLEALATLAFDYPEAPNKPGRSAMFLRELEDYLVWCRDAKLDPAALTGSYTGAIGIPQFLPSSIRTYAVDYDGDGRIDLQESADDAIGSVAHYLKDQGWQPGRPIFWGVARTRKSLAAIAEKADGDPELKWRLGDLLSLGVVPQGLRSSRRTEREARVVIIDLPSPDRPTEYRIGLNNFYAITRYNRSFFYAMSVVELGRAVKQAARRSKRTG
jgi:membrane-bound lytic murein transglycosylase B